MAATAAFALLFAACAGVPPGTKAGGGDVPLTIDVVTSEPQGSALQASLERFAGAVEELSDGTIDVEIEYQAYQRVTQMWDAAGTSIVADLVAAGDADIAFTPEWVWIARGTPALAALRTPFLIDRQGVLQAVATGELGNEMLGDLAPHGVHGLALLPYGLRHPISFGEPILAPGDLAGESLRTLDPLGAELFAGLGADVRVVDGNDYFSSVARGEIRGADASPTTAFTHPQFGSITADLAYFPMSAVIVANTGWFDALGADQQSILRQAAIDTIESVIDSTMSPATAAEAYCEAGGTVVLAGEALVAQWREAGGPIRGRLESDPATLAAIAAIEALGREAPPERQPARACDGGAVETTPSPRAPASSEAFPEGVYRSDIPVSAFLDAGIDEQRARNHAGIWTLTFRGGTWEATDAQSPVHDCPASTYRVADERVTITLGTHGTTCGSAAGRELFNAAWEFDGSALRFVDVRAGAGGGSDAFMQALFGSTPWTAIG